MRDHGKYQKWIADKCGISEQQLSLVFNGKRGLTLELAEKLADIFNVSIDYLINRDFSQLTDCQKNVLEVFDKIENDDKKLLLTIIDKWLPSKESKQSGDSHIGSSGTKTGTEKRNISTRW
jgi:transcriptional regulator with XRE-family HTH domain